MKGICAAVVVTLAAALWPALALAEDADAVERARVLHEEGVRLFRDGRYREAVGAFDQAEQLAPNPLNLYNQARCYQELGEHEAALGKIEQYLAAQGLTDEDRAGAERVRSEILEAQRAAGAAPPEAPPPEQTAPESPDGEPGSEPASTQPAQTPEAPPPAPEEGPSLAGPWALLGTGLGLAAAGGVLDVVAFVRSDASGQFGTYDEYLDWRSGARALAIAGDVLVGVGAAAAVGGLIWLLVARSRRPAGQARLRAVSLLAARDGMFLSLGLDL